jgi:thymidylate kinase
VAVLVAVVGASPGIGKSTLCTALAGWLSGAGLRVDHFREEEILTRAAFTAVAAEFTSTGVVQLPTLLDAVADFVSSIEASGDDVVIADSLIPFMPSLLAWGHDEETIAGFLGDLSGLLAPVTPIVVYVDGDPVAALARAAEREEPGWLDWFVGKLAGYQVTPAVHDVDTAAAYLTREGALTLRVVRRQPWDLVVVDGRTPIEVQRRAQDLLTPLLSGRGAGRLRVR